MVARYAMGGALARVPAVTLALLLAFWPAAAQEPLPEPAARWYEALRMADGEAFARLLAQDAAIDLRDVGIVQNREEFVESMDAWEDAVRGAQILTRLQSRTDDSAVVDVCYRFPANARLNRETFQFAGDQVAGLVQEQLAATCEGF